ncbi:helix-turn-helix transcriptional regulator [Methylomonas albis]|uniref:AlpA family transcriptional regulator n=1 Tax=Methylomonas albis TaxID=1854563 RepID=A0ABR9CWH7_9GAMM|nr:AlpA family transcriptional regulator [Methylomonas albis]MBD9354831.1 AlpA family transcriptional regulator [Methylomonas albis]
MKKNDINYRQKNTENKEESCSDGPEIATEIQIIRIKAVCEKTGVSRSGLYRLVASGDFPKPISLTSYTKGWIESEVNQWLQERAKKRKSIDTTAK